MSDIDSLSAEPNIPVVVSDIDGLNASVSDSSRMPQSLTVSVLKPVAVVLMPQSLTVSVLKSVTVVRMTQSLTVSVLKSVTVVRMAQSLTVSVLKSVTVVGWHNH